MKTEEKRKNMKNQEEKPECEKSPSGRHNWKWTQIKEDRIKWPRGDWGAPLPRQYCIHCKKCKGDENT